MIDWEVYGQNKLINNWNSHFYINNNSDYIIARNQKWETYFKVKKPYNCQLKFNSIIFIIKENFFIFYY